MDNTRTVWQRLLNRIQKRPKRLVGGRVAEYLTRCTTIPEVAADEVVLYRVEM